MRHVSIENKTHPLIQPIRAKYCASFWCRLRGLTFRRSLEPCEGLLLVQSRESRMDAAIHMLGVPMDLAVIWINSAKEVVDLRLARSWRMAYTPKQPARYVLETAPPLLAGFQTGDQLEFSELSEA
jgi:uncharacterized membrane protein (UPF0127 family)